MAKKGTQHPAFWLVLIQWVLAFEWLYAGWGKFADNEFMAMLPDTLTTFASQTSHAFYADFLRSSIIPNAMLIGNAVRAGELLIGASLSVGGAVVLWYPKYRRYAVFWLAVVLSGAAVLNLNYYWAAGGLHPSTWGVNAVMGLSSAVLAVYYLIEAAKIENLLVLNEAKSKVKAAAKKRLANSRVRAKR